jgi:hypothetical protein
MYNFYRESSNETLADFESESFNSSINSSSEDGLIDSAKVSIVNFGRNRILMMLLRLAFKPISSSHPLHLPQLSNSPIPETLPYNAQVHDERKIESDNDSYINSQHELFEQHKSYLLERYENQYVVFRDGKVILSGDDEIALIDNAYAELGFKKPFILRQVLRKDPEYIICTPIDPDDANFL